MQKEKGKGLVTSAGTGKKGSGFISIEKRISKRVAQTILVSCIVLGLITSILSYFSSVSAVSKTINTTSDGDADYVSAALGEYKAIAYETGSIARLADPDRDVEDKKDILNQRIRDHDFVETALTDEK